MPKSSIQLMRRVHLEEQNVHVTVTDQLNMWRYEGKLGCCLHSLVSIHLMNQPSRMTPPSTYWHSSPHENDAKYYFTLQLFQIFESSPKCFFKKFYVSHCEPNTVPITVRSPTVHRNQWIAVTLKRTAALAHSFWIINCISQFLRIFHLHNFLVQSFTTSLNLPKEVPSCYPRQ